MITSCYKAGGAGPDWTLPGGCNLAIIHCESQKSRKAVRDPKLPCYMSGSSRLH